MTYGSEAWAINKAAYNIINGAESCLLRKMQKKYSTLNMKHTKQY